jgi:hypothetical protein
VSRRFVAVVSAFILAAAASCHGPDLPLVAASSSERRNPRRVRVSAFAGFTDAHQESLLGALGAKEGRAGVAPIDDAIDARFRFGTKSPCHATTLGGGNGEGSSGSLLFRRQIKEPQAPNPRPFDSPSADMVAPPVRRGRGAVVGAGDVESHFTLAGRDAGARTERELARASVVGGSHGRPGDFQFRRR